ncbi:flagellar basal-body MS-ring/collar protein FliF [Clostridium sp. DL1XJH146]
MGVLKGFTDRISNGWKSLDKGMKVVIGGVGVSAIVSMFIYFTVFAGTNYETLYTDLSLTDSANIVSQLETLKIEKYKLEDNGTTILVDEKQIDKLRLDLAMSGSLPNSGSGYELFDDIGIMVTDEDRKIMYQRALEGELQRSIASLQEINSARVHLVLAEDSLFSDEGDPASASILLDIKQGQTLSTAQVKGIISLVSGAVNNLSEENVKVLDSESNLLSAGVIAGSEYNDTTAAMNKLDLENTKNMEIEYKITNTLEKTFGAGKAVVNVSVEMDMDTEESISKDYTGDPVVISEQKNYESIEETDTGENPSDTGGYIADDDITSDPNTQSYDVIRNYETGEITRTVKKAVGTIEKISANIIMDAELTDDEKQTIKDIVIASIGASEARGDVINVAGIPFDTTLQDAIQDDINSEVPETGAMTSILNAVSVPVLIGIIIGLLLIILVPIILLVRRSRNKKEKNREKELDKIILEGTLSTDEIKHKEIVDEVIIDTGKVKRTMQDEINKYASENPKEAAELLKLWLIEGREAKNEK